jgi:hypothetical protein
MWAPVCHLLKPGDFVNVSVRKVLHCVRSVGAAECFSKELRKNQKWPRSRVIALPALTVSTLAYCHIMLLLKLNVYINTSVDGKGGRNWYKMVPSI